MSSTCIATTTGAHTAKNTSDGRSSRAARARTNASVAPPRRRCDSYAVRLANPPTKKNSGMTWNNHVASHNPRVTPTAFVLRMMPSCQLSNPIHQWPTTTARMLAARTKSTTRSRSAGVRAARSATPEGFTDHRYASIRPRSSSARTVAGR